MTGYRRAACFWASALTISGCSGGSGAARDSSKPEADSVTAATVGTRGASPPGEPTPSTGSPARTTPAAKPRPATGPPSVPNVGGPSGRPHLVTLAPASRSLGTGQVVTVEVTGDGFTARGNTVFFGSMNLGDVPSDGRLLRFAIPETVPSRSEVPPMAVQAGRYGVYVVNANGTSDTLFFTIRTAQD